MLIDLEIKMPARGASLIISNERRASQMYLPFLKKGRYIWLARVESFYPYGQKNSSGISFDYSAVLKISTPRYWDIHTELGG